MMARAMTRKGTALEKMEDPEGAISWYNRALTEHRNPDTLGKLRKVEAAFKKSTEEAYQSPELAEAEKAKGNDAFKAQQVRILGCRVVGWWGVGAVRGKMAVYTATF